MFESGKSLKDQALLPLRIALGLLIIQQRLGLSDRDLVEQITKNPYLQYFFGLKAFQKSKAEHQKSDNPDDDRADPGDMKKQSKPIQIEKEWMHQGRLLDQGKTTEQILDDLCIELQTLSIKVYPSIGTDLDETVLGFSHNYFTFLSAKCAAQDSNKQNIRV